MIVFKQVKKVISFTLIIYANKYRLERAHIWSSLLSSVYQLFSKSASSNPALSLS